MEQWQDDGVVLSARPHGENGAVVSILTEQYGRHAGFVPGGRSSRMRGVLEPGSRVRVEWRSRVADQLGSFRLEQEHCAASRLMHDPLRLSALMSACELCDKALPEREAHPGLYRGMLALLETLESEAWGASYVIWEIMLLRELGFGMDLSRCAGGGDSATLAWVSPRTGCAVSYKAGEPYRDRLLPLPAFLKPNGGPADDEEVYAGLRMTGHFLEHWVFMHNTTGIPAERLRFQERMAKAAEVTAA